MKQRNFMKMEESLKSTLLDLDEKIKEKYYSEYTGTTACIVLITDKKIYCANLGDSRAVLYRN